MKVSALRMIIIVRLKEDTELIHSSLLLLT